MSKQMDLFLEKIQALMVEAELWINQGFEKRNDYFNLFKESEVAQKGNAWLMQYYQAYLIYIEGSINYVPDFLLKYLMHIQDWSMMLSEMGYQHYEALKTYHLMFLITQEVEDCQRLTAKLSRIQALLLLLHKLGVVLRCEFPGLEALYLKYQAFLLPTFGIDALLSQKDELEHIIMDLLMLKNDVMEKHPGLIEELFAFEQTLEDYLSGFRTKHRFFNKEQPHKKQAIVALQHVLTGHACLNAADIEMLNHGKLGKSLQHFPKIWPLLSERMLVLKFKNSI